MAKKPKKPLTKTELKIKKLKGVGHNPGADPQFPPLKVKGEEKTQSLVTQGRSTWQANQRRNRADRTYEFKKDPHDPKTGAMRCTHVDKETGWRCQSPPIKGGSVCRVHGGGIPSVRRAAARRAVREQLNFLGRILPPEESDPMDHLVREIGRTAGHVEWLDLRVAKLTPQEALSPKGQLLIDLHQWEREHLVKTCKVAVQAGLATRIVRLAEDQARLMARVLASMLNDLGDRLSPEDRELAVASARKHLSLAATSPPQQQTQIALERVNP